MIDVRNGGMECWCKGGVGEMRIERKECGGGGGC